MNETFLLWLALDVDAQLQALRRRVEQLSCQLGCENPALTLPLHVSLRISFPVENRQYDAVFRHITRYAAGLTAFPMMTDGLAQRGNIVWLRIADNSRLNQIHQELVDQLESAYGIQPAPFDRHFLFHASLMLLPHDDMAQRALSALQAASWPDALEANRFVIGCSPTGRAGTYQVIWSHALPHGRP